MDINLFDGIQKIKSPWRHTLLLCCRIACSFYDSTALIAIKINLIATSDCINVLYQLECSCDSPQVGCTSQRIRKSITSFPPSRSRGTLSPAFCKTISSNQHYLYTSLSLASIFRTTRNSLFVTATTDSLFLLESFCLLLFRYRSYFNLTIRFFSMPKNLF